MIQYYREKNGDYLVIDPDTADYYRETYGGKAGYGGRATAIGGLVTSICTTAIGAEYLESCTEVDQSEVPTEWLDRLT